MHPRRLIGPSRVQGHVHLRVTCLTSGGRWCVLRELHSATGTVFTIHEHLDQWGKRNLECNIRLIMVPASGEGVATGRQAVICFRTAVRTAPRLRGRCPAEIARTTFRAGIPENGECGHRVIVVGVLRVPGADLVLCCGGVHESTHTKCECGEEAFQWSHGKGMLVITWPKVPRRGGAAMRRTT